METKGYFAAELRGSFQWQIAEARQGSRTAGLASATQGLTSPWDVSLGGLANRSTQGTNGGAELRSETPARVVVDTHYDNVRPAGTLRTSARYSVYANGRVVVGARIENVALTPLSFPLWFEYGHVFVAADLPATVPLVGTDRGFFFTASGASLLLITHSATDPMGQNSTTNRYFDIVPAPSLDPGAFVERSWELRLWPAGLDEAALRARIGGVHDARPMATISGASGAYDKTASALVITYASAPIGVKLAPERPHHEPIFVVQNWPGSTFRVSRNGALVASHRGSLSATLTAAVDETSRELVVTSFETIPAGASEDLRSFTFQP
jgi:hypothetical protein